MLARKQIDRLDEFAHQTGFDPRRDVRELLISSNGKDIIVAARGTFNVRAFEGMTRSTYKGSTLYTRDRRAVALIDNSTAIAGTVEAVRAALTTSRIRRSFRARGPLARADPTGEQVWSVSNASTTCSPAGFLKKATPPTPAGSCQLERTAAADLRAGLNGYSTASADGRRRKNPARGAPGWAWAGLAFPRSSPNCCACGTASKWISSTAPSRSQ